MENSIAIKKPELAKQWHETENGKLTPFHVTVGSNKKVCIDNCLTTLNPGIAKQWHPTKNGTLTPYAVTRSSSKRVW
ncbi:hypothetical protein BTJ44_00615 [Bacillus mycoides]|nr:hypothetical protein BTJ44_00615 [Bacillus mycoides]